MSAGQTAFVSFTACNNGGDDPITPTPPTPDPVPTEDIAYQAEGLYSVVTTYMIPDSTQGTIDAEDLGSGCCTPHTYRKVHAIYVIKDGNTKNLKYDFPSITKELKDLGINTKIVW